MGWNYSDLGPGSRTQERAAFAGLRPADGKAIAEAARLISTAKNPVVLVGMIASRPANAEALQTFLTNGRLPVVGTFQAAGAVGAPLFDTRKLTSDLERAYQAIQARHQAGLATAHIDIS